MDPNQKREMPDIALSERSQFQSQLEWVGMEKIAIPVQLPGNRLVAAEADVFVNLAKKEAKGIHMSRLYLALHEELENKPLTKNQVSDLLTHFVESQQGLADSSLLVLRWDELLKRKALLSDNKGWKNYPVELRAVRQEGQNRFELKFSIFYSSTCPCSAALARQLYQKAFAKEFCDDTLSFEKVFQWLGETRVAAPHSQRSRADITVEFNNDVNEFPIETLIDLLEEGLKTPVQSAVKREDEQEFARLNGENSMFVEDALRNMKNTLSEFESVTNFHVKTHHFESLHAHDAVGSIKK